MLRILYNSRSDAEMSGKFKMFLWKINISENIPYSVLVAMIEFRIYYIKDIQGEWVFN